MSDILESKDKFSRGLEKIGAAEKVGTYQSPNRKREGNKYTHSWTGNKIKQERLHGGRFEVGHTSASGWHVFDHHTNTVASDGHKHFDEATQHAKKFAKHYGELPSQHSEQEPTVEPGHVSVERAREIVKGSPGLKR